MLHIYRHVSGLVNFHPVVLTQKREGDWPVRDIRLVRRSTWRFLAREGEKRTGRPWQISRRETESFLRMITEEKCRLLHVFFGNVAVHLLPLLRACPVPVIISFHGSDVTGSMASIGYGEAVREMLSLARLIPCRSHQLASRVAQLGAPPEKLRVMRTVLPDIPFTPRQAPPDGSWHIVQAARLVPKKGLFTALTAFADFVKIHPRAVFSIAGDGPLKDELMARVASLHLEGNVVFHGFLSQPRLLELFASSHIFLQPSETVGGDVEGIPNAMLEAAASGLPLVATRHGGIPEVIANEETGLLCAERDPSALCAALLRLAGDASLYAKLGAQGSAHIRSQFGEARQIEAIETMYREVILASTT